MDERPLVPVVLAVIDIEKGLDVVGEHGAAILRRTKVMCIAISTVVAHMACCCSVGSLSSMGESKASIVSGGGLLKSS